MPKPLPTNIKRLRGTIRPAREIQNQPQPATANIRAPKTLSPGARKHWDSAVRQLKKAGVMTVLDTAALSMFCEAYERWLSANKKIADTGLIVNAPSGYPMQNPLIAVSNRAFDQLSKMLVEFGMTPSSRTRISVAEDSNKDDEWNNI